MLPVAVIPAADRIERRGCRSGLPDCQVEPLNPPVEYQLEALGLSVPTLDVRQGHRPIERFRVYLGIGRIEQECLIGPLLELARFSEGC